MAKSTEFGSIEKVVSIQHFHLKQRVITSSELYCLRRRFISSMLPQVTTSAPRAITQSLDWTLRFSHENGFGLSVDVRIKDKYGSSVGLATIGGFDPAQMIDIYDDKLHYIIAIDVMALAKGIYTLSIDVAIPNITYLDHVEDCLSIELNPIPSGRNQRILDQDWGFGSFLVGASLL